MEGQKLAARHIALRERAALTQEQEAKMAGVSPTTISGIESGKITRPHLRTLLKIARALGADVGELRDSGKAEAPPSPTQPPLNGFQEERRREPEDLWQALSEIVGEVVVLHGTQVLYPNSRAEWETLEKALKELVTENSVLRATVAELREELAKVRETA